MGSGGGDRCENQTPGIYCTHLGELRSKAGRGRLFLPRGWSSGEACCPHSRWNCSQSPSQIQSCSPSHWMSCCRCCCCRCCCPCWKARRLCSWPAGPRRCQPARPPRKEREGKPSEQTQNTMEQAVIRPKERRGAQGSAHLSTITWNLKNSHQVTGILMVKKEKKNVYINQIGNESWYPLVVRQSFLKGGWCHFRMNVSGNGFANAPLIRSATKRQGNPKCLKYFVKTGNVCLLYFRKWAVRKDTAFCSVLSWPAERFWSLWDHQSYSPASYLFLPRELNAGVFAGAGLLYKQ